MFPCMGHPQFRTGFLGLIFLPIVCKDLLLLVFLIILLMTSFSLLKQYTNSIVLSHNYLSLEYSGLHCLQITFGKANRGEKIYKFP